DAGVGEQCGGLLGGAALLRLQRVGALLVEAERVDAVDDQLSGEFLAERLERLAVAVPGHGDDHDVAAAGRLGVVGALDAVPELLGGGAGALGGPGADDHLLAGLGEAEGEALALRPGAAEHADDEPGDVGQVPGVLGGGLRGAPGGLLCAVGRGHGADSTSVAVPYPVHVSAVTGGSGGTGPACPGRVNRGRTPGGGGRVGAGCGRMDAVRVALLREVLAGTEWLGATRRFAGVLRGAVVSHGGGLLLVGTRAYEPWHLAAHLVDEAAWSGTPELAPTLVRHGARPSDPAHLAVGP